MKTRVTLLMVLVSFCFFFTAKAQNKIGHISIQELVNYMPEYKKALQDLDDYEKALVAQGQEYQADYARQDSIFRTDSTGWNAAVKEVKRRELNSIYLKMINFNQEAQKLMESKEQDILRPIQKKAVETTQQVAKENGYGYVLGKEQLIAMPSSDDILPLVLKKLGLSQTPAETKTSPAAPATPAKKN